MVNEMFPPPTIRVKVGDLVTLTLVNLLLSIAVTVHIHGARSECRDATGSWYTPQDPSCSAGVDQLGTPWDDGTGMVTM